VKFLDKIKNLFTDEIEEDEEIELEEDNKNDYKEPPKDVLPKVMRDTITKEEKKINPDEFLEQLNSNSQTRRTQVQDMSMNGTSLNKREPEVMSREASRKFSFPMDMEEDLGKRDVKKANNVNVLNIQKEASKKNTNLYPKKEEIKAKPKFKATPVISPVYGILDKNYTKEEIRERNEDNVIIKRPSKKVDFETVRKKAFGNLADDIKDNLMCENCELYKEVKKMNSLHEGDLLYDMTVEEQKDVTIEKAYDDYEEFGVEYEPKVEKTADDVVDDNTNNGDIVINDVNDNSNNHDIDLSSNVDEISNEDVASVKEDDVPSRSEKKKETKVDDDFFQLIDSMYKERTDD